MYPLPSFLHRFRSRKISRSTYIKAFGYNPEAQEIREKDQPIAGTLAILFTILAFLTAVFSVLDFGSDFQIIRSWLSYIVVLFGGLIFFPVIGGKFEFYQPLNREINAKVLGFAVIGGLSTVIIQLILQTVSSSIAFSSTDFNFVLLSPASETFGFNVTLFMAIRLRFPELSWMVGNLISSTSFAFFHFFRYGGYTEFILILAVLFIGNSILNYVFEVTRQVIAPMISHLITNIFALNAKFILFLQQIIPYIVVISIVVGIVYIVFFKMHLNKLRVGKMVIGS